MIMVDEKALGAAPPAYEHIDQDSSQQIIQYPELSQLPQSSGGYPPSPYSVVSQTPTTVSSPGALIQSPHENGYPAQPVQPPMSLGARYQQELLERCARGDHDVTTKRGALGIICAVMLFPIGLLCLMTDVERRCARCGISIN